jgi:hypothetical protein
LTITLEALRESAVGIKIDACAIRTLVGSQEECSSGHFFRGSESPYQGKARHILAALISFLFALKLSIDDRCINGPRA